MPKRKKDRKKFKDTKVGIFLKEKLPEALDIADDFLPPLKILTILLKPNVKEEEINEIYKEVNIPTKVTYNLSKINLSESQIKKLTKLYEEDFAMKSTRWYLSKTFWAAIIIAVLIILQGQGVDVPIWIIGLLTSAGLLSARFQNKKLNKSSE